MKRDFFFVVLVALTVDLLVPTPGHAMQGRGAASDSVRATAKPPAPPAAMAPT